MSVSVNFDKWEKPILLFSCSTFQPDCPTQDDIKVSRCDLTWDLRMHILALFKSISIEKKKKKAIKAGFFIVVLLWL